MLAKAASTLLICLCTLTASGGFTVSTQAGCWVAGPPSCVGCNSDALFWRYDLFTPQLRHFFRPLQFDVLQ